MIDRNKVAVFCTAISNAYRSEENQETIPKIEFRGDAVEDFTAMVYALKIIFDLLTESNMDVIDFTHLLNKIVVQELIESKEE